MHCRRVPLSILVPMLVPCLFAASAIAADGEEFQDFAELDLESLLDQTVVTASRYEQKVGDTPVDVTVITEQEIAVSGARSIPELLRTIPGIDVIQTSSSSYDVAARGMNRPGSNAMLVLIDGRSVYEDLYGMTMWDQLPIGLEDIKSIEVSKGPGSAMYGANAFSGVINIITYPYREKTGTSARAMVSSLGEGYGAVRHEGTANNTTWRLNTAWDRTEDWENDITESEVARFNAHLHQNLGANSNLTLGTAVVNALSKFIPSDMPLIVDGTNYFHWAEYDRNEFKARWYSNRRDLAMMPTVRLAGWGKTRFESRIHDFELQQSFALHDEHYLLVGGNYRHKENSFSEQDAVYQEDIYAGFLLEEWHPSENLFFSAGLRYEHNPAIDSHISPRGGLVYRPHERHAFRLSYGKAYRDPSFIETHWSASFELIPGMTQALHGDSDNESEVIRSVEIGYQGLLKDRLLLAVAVFRNEMDDLIQPKALAFFPSPPAPPSIPSDIGMVNSCSRRSTGGEMSCKYEPTNWLRISSGYSYVWVEDSDTGDHVAQAPVHAASLAARLRPHDGHEFHLAGRYRSDSWWARNTAEVATMHGQERIFADASWSFVPNVGRRFTLAVENLFDRRVADHPLSIEQKRRILISLGQDF